VLIWKINALIWFHGKKMMKKERQGAEGKHPLKAQKTAEFVVMGQKGWSYNEEGKLAAR